ncbi:DNA cytosine methyltransferase [Xanthobacter sediminis]
MNVPFLPPAGSKVLELVVDSFACGGGASTGIRIALGRSPDIALNHDRWALAMYRANHPGTRLMLQDVATVDGVGMCEGLPIGLLWMSPDCTDHSKAKGAAPLRIEGQTSRGIGWAIVGWVRPMPEWQRPRVVILENVEEYVHWGPLLPNGKRCPKRKGETFRAFVAAWEALGYVVEWREQRAWGRGAGTIRKRLYMVMRRDGEPIVWPERTHGNPFDPADAARIAAGELKTWVTAADSIDFSLPIPSIFDTAAAIRDRLGITAKRPLAPKTMARLAYGVKRHVLHAAKVGRAFIVKVNHTARAGERRDRGTDLPLTALTGKRDDALVAPVITYAQQGGAVRSAAAPVHTLTASPKDQNAVIASYLVPRYGERDGQAPRTCATDRPGPTPVPTGNEGSLATVHMMTMRHSNTPSSAVDRPARTLVANGAAETVVAAYIAQHNDGPRPGAPGHPADEPISTITVTGSQQSLVAAHMITLRGSHRQDSSAAAPTYTASAGGNHDAVVSLPLLTAYYGTDEVGGAVDVPLRTDTAKPRFGLVEAQTMVPPFAPEHEARAREVAEFLRAHDCWDGGEFVTVEIEGVTYVIVDICMRMLTPRERYNAQGFPRDYIIDHGIDADGSILPFSLERQGSMCGNAVCPPEAAALVSANYQPREVIVPRRRRQEAQPSLFAEAAE